MLVSRSDNPGEPERSELRQEEAVAPARAVPDRADEGRVDAGKALETARILDRLRWEERCEAMQRRVNQAHILERSGNGVRLISWQVLRWCFVVLLGSCFIAWTGWLAMLVACGAILLIVPSLLALLLGSGVELAAVLWQSWLLHQGEREHLDLCDPSFRPVR